MEGTRSRPRPASGYLTLALAPLLRLLTLSCSERTRKLVQFDLTRARARRRMPRRVKPWAEYLHVGCGPRRVAGFVNIDVAASELDVDLASGALPFPDESFSAVVAQHVIEHLELRRELLPLLRELRRVLKPGGEIWLSTPDMEKVCRLYVDGHIRELIDDRSTRWTTYSLEGAPDQHFLNDLFHQAGEHRNLLDQQLLNWTLEQTGFSEIERQREADLLLRFPGFPPRRDDFQTLLVLARRSEER